MGACACQVRRQCDSEWRRGWQLSLWVRVWPALGVCRAHGGLLGGAGVAAAVDAEGVRL